MGKHKSTLFIIILIKVERGVENSNYKRKSVKELTKIKVLINRKIINNNNNKNNSSSIGNSSSSIISFCCSVLVCKYASE